MSGIREMLIALGKAMEHNDCLDETQWEIMDKLTLTPVQPTPPWWKSFLP